MALVTCLAVVLIAANIIVFVCQFTGIVVLMTIDATELFEITSYGMALDAIIPLAFVLATEYWKIQIIVLSEILSRPARLDGVANRTICRKTIGLVIGRCCSQVILFMAGKAIRRCTRKSPVGVAGIAILNFMPTRQREEIVIGSAGSPKPPFRSYIVTVHAIGAVTCCLVIGRSCCLKIFQVAVDAVVPYSVKPNRRF